MKTMTRASDIHIKSDYLSIDEYLSMPYIRVVYPTGEPGDAAFFGEILEFDGCIATGASEEEVLANLKDATETYLRAAIKLGMEIPKPLKTAKSSGKVLVRMKPTLHDKLIINAKQEGVSLNQYIVTSIVAGMR